MARIAASAVCSDAGRSSPLARRSTRLIEYVNALWQEGPEGRPEPPSWFESIPWRINPLGLGFGRWALVGESAYHARPPARPRFRRPASWRAAFEIPRSGERSRQHARPLRRSDCQGNRAAVHVDLARVDALRAHAPACTANAVRRSYRHLERHQLCSPISAPLQRRHTRTSGQAAVACRRCAPRFTLRCGRCALTTTLRRRR